MTGPIQSAGSCVCLNGSRTCAKRFFFFFFSIFSKSESLLLLNSVVYSQRTSGKAIAHSVMVG